MSNPFRRNKFTNIGNILPKVVEKLDLDKRLNEQALFCLWPSLVDEIYAERSIPLYIDESNNLIVAVKDSSTAQELSFAKSKLIQKLKSIAPQFGLTMNGLRFDLKQYNLAKQLQEEKYSQKIGNENTYAHIKNEQLKDLVLTEDELTQINDFRIAMEKAALNLEQFCSEGQTVISIRVANLMEKQLRLKKWHKSQNLPFCKSCNEPLYQPKIEFCHYCVQIKQSQP